MSDPIRAALKAAARDLVAAYGLPPSDRAAAAIAAFLRHRARRAAADNASTIPIEWMHEAAAAVERAAKEAPDADPR